MKVAIVGLSPTHDLAPWGDPEWEKWGLPWDEGYWRRMDRLFEMHNLEHFPPPKADYLDRLRSIEVPLYMQDTYFPNVTRYPLEAVAEITGWYWESSIAYMTALAIYERAEEVALFGVDAKSDDEYGYQKPNLEYLIGLARGMGIKVHIPDESPLCKFDGAGVSVNRYGWGR